MNRAAWGGSPVPALAGLEGVRPRAAIDTSPFSGLVLILLITYMVITPNFAIGPRVPSVATERRPIDMATLGIDRRGVFYVGDRPAADQNLAEAIRTELAAYRTDVLLIKSDPEAPYERVETALRGMQAAGVRRVMLDARPAR